MMTSSLLLSFRGAYLANLSSVPSILTILGHSPRWVEDSFAALHMHMRHVLSLSTNRCVSLAVVIGDVYIVARCSQVFSASENNVASLRPPSPSLKIKMATTP
eukprot:scaffold150620_cov35-Tisochrysis_lutea.AAC.5